MSLGEMCSSFIPRVVPCGPNFGFCREEIRGVLNERQLGNNLCLAAKLWERNFGKRRLGMKGSRVERGSRLQLLGDDRGRFMREEALVGFLGPTSFTEGLGGRRELPASAAKCNFGVDIFRVLRGTTNSPGALGSAPRQRTSGSCPALVYRYPSLILHVVFPSFGGFF